MTRVILPSIIIEMLRRLTVEEEGALLIGNVSERLIVVEGIALVPCEVKRDEFYCVPPPRDDVVGVYHRHRGPPSALDRKMSRLWHLYLVDTREGLKVFVKGELVRPLDW